VAAAEGKGRGVQQGHLDLLVALALHEGGQEAPRRGGAAATTVASVGTLLRRKATITTAAASASAASRVGNATSPAQSPDSAVRAIPATAKPKGVGPSPPSAPVRSPRKPATGRWDESNDDDFRIGVNAMLPPHEMVVRQSASGIGPAAPFSMLEGLRWVRDAVLRQTGFLD
jgi:hypothetical protein